MAYGKIRGTGKTVDAGRGRTAIELGVSSDGTGGPAKDAYFTPLGASADSGNTGRVCVRTEVIPHFHGPLYGHISVFEGIDAAT